MLMNHVLCVRTTILSKLRSYHRLLLQRSSSQYVVN